MQQLECVLQGRIRLTSDTFLYRFDVLGPPMMFMPGQFVSLSIPNISTGAHVTRAYSIAGVSGATVADSSTCFLSTQRFELIIRHLVDGKGTALLRDLPLGTKMSSMYPAGRLTVDLATMHDGPVVFVANATGIAPFRSMMQYLEYAQKYIDVTVLWGLRTTQDVYLFKELVQYENEWQVNGGRFHIYFCLSQEQSIPSNVDLGDTHVRLGRVQTSFNLLTGRNYKFFICGSKSFVLDVKQFLEVSFPESEICLERFN